MTESTQNHSWPELFHASIDYLAPRLSQILDVADCRERWLQAEMYFYLRQFDRAFKIGHVAVSRGSKLDFYGEVPVPMIAELKVLGSGYAPKCFNGTGKIPECFSAARDGQRVPATGEHLDEATGYFLHDVNRLRDAAGDFQRYMILVVDRRPPVDRLGRALMAIQISSQERTFESPNGDWIARIWALDRMNR